jgi:hypothetical protein
MASNEPPGALQASGDAGRVTMLDGVGRAVINGGPSERLALSGNAWTSCAPRLRYSFVCYNE